MKDTHLLRNNSENNRNAKTYKTIKTNQGQIDIKIPIDRESSFAPVVIKKYEKTLVQLKIKLFQCTLKEWQSHPLSEVPLSIDLRAFSYAIENESSPVVKFSNVLSIK